MHPSRRHFLQTMGLGTAALGTTALGTTALGTTALGTTALGTGWRLPWQPTQAQDEPDFWRMVRRQFPLTDARTYLNTGGLGPASYGILDAVHETMMALQRVSETGHRHIEEARVPVAAFFGAAPEEVAFMRNATEGNATVAAGLRLGAGDEVILESHAHPGGAIPWLNRQKQHGIRVRIFDPSPESDADNLQRINDLITPRTRVVQVSHVTAPTGLRFPVPEIARLARDRGLWFHVDGAQSAGMFPVDIKALGCDSYATSGHKWLCGPHGTGLLYIQKDRLDDVAPTEVGAYSDRAFDLPDVFDYHPTARRYECGTRDAAQVVGLGQAVAFLTDIGMDRVAAYSQGLARTLQAALREIPGVTVLTPDAPERSGAITTFKTDAVRYDDLYRQFAQEHRLRCRIVTERGLDALRVSTHIFNNADDVARVVAATRAVLGL